MFVTVNGADRTFYTFECKFTLRCAFCVHEYVYKIFAQAQVSPCASYVHVSQQVKGESHFLHDIHSATQASLLHDLHWYTEMIKVLSILMCSEQLIRATQTHCFAGKCVTYCVQISVLDVKIMAYSHVHVVMQAHVRLY